MGKKTRIAKDGMQSGKEPDPRERESWVNLEKATKVAIGALQNLRTGVAKGTIVPVCGKVQLVSPLPMVMLSRDHLDLPVVGKLGNEVSDLDVSHTHSCSLA